MLNRGDGEVFVLWIMFLITDLKGISDSAKQPADSCKHLVSAVLTDTLTVTSLILLCRTNGVEELAYNCCPAAKGLV